MKTLTIYTDHARPIRVRGKRACELMLFAKKYRGWHSFKQASSTQTVVNTLVSKGYLLTINDQFKFNNNFGASHVM